MGKWEMVDIPEMLFFQEGPGVRNTQYTSYGVKLLNVANLQNGRIDLSTSDRYISEEEAHGKYKHFLVDEGDLIIASSGIQVDYFEKKMGFILSSHLPLCMNTSTIRFKSLDNNKLYIKYFMYYLKTNQFKMQLSKFITGSAQLNFGPSHLKQMNFPLPPFPIQQKIADVLDRANALVEKRKAQIEKLDLLVKSQFVEMFGDPVTNPMEWQLYKLNDICSIIVDCPHSTPNYIQEYTGYMCIRTSILKPNQIDWGNIEYISQKQYIERTKRYIPKKNDIIYSREGAILGIAALIDKDFKVALGQRMMLLSINLEICNPKYICYMMNSKFIISQVESKISGSASPHINVADVKDFKITLPPLELQNQFAAFVERVETQKSQMKKGLELMELGYKSLMQKCFNGEMFTLK